MIPKITEGNNSSNNHGTMRMMLFSAAAFIDFNEGKKMLIKKILIAISNRSTIAKREYADG